MTRPTAASSLLLAYLALTADTGVRNVAVGALVATAIALLVDPGRGRTDLRALARALPALARYLVVLAIDLVQSGVGVARIVLHPALPIRPGIIAIPSGCRSELATALSAHAITVTPGQVVLEIDADGVMFTHCLDVTGAEAATAAAQRLRRDLLQRIVE